MSSDITKMVCLIAVLAACVVLREKVSGATMAQLVCLAVAGAAWLFVGRSEYVQARKRNKLLPPVARELGLDFRPDKNTAFLQEWSFLDATRQGLDQYATNIFNGQYSGERVFAFDLNYQESRGNHFTHTFLMLVIEGVSFPKVAIVPKLPGAGLISSIEEIEFDSAEFSAKFLVISNDKKFAYDVCHPRMMELLLRYPQTDCVIQGPAIIMNKRCPLRPEGYKYALDELVEIRSLLPKYLFEKT